MNIYMNGWMDTLDMCLPAYLNGEVGLGIEQLGAEGQQQLLVGVDDVRRLNESLHPHRLHSANKKPHPQSAPTPASQQR